LDTFVTRLVNQELLLRNECLLAEDRILPAHLPSRLRLTDPERRTLAEVAKQTPMSILTLRDAEVRCRAASKRTGRLRDEKP